MKQIIISVCVGIVLVAGYYFGKSLYLRPDIKQGTKAKEITSILPDGSEFALSQLKGKYVLLDFWGSWCKPCREAHPNLIQLYNDFQKADFKNASGFEIVSFGVEQNEKHWKSAIAQDGLLWPYQLLSTDLFNSAIIKKYNVKQIPTKFLINPEGMIIGVDPPLNEVRRILNEYLVRDNPD